MKKLSFLILILSIVSTISISTFAQEGKVVQKPADQTSIAPAHRILFQMTSGDTMAYKQLMKQLNNIVTVAPGTKVEVVSHGPGLDMLITEKSIVADKIKKLSKEGVVFNACEFSMSERKVEKSQMIPETSYVPYAILHIATRQEQGWSYIKAGF